MTTTIFASFNDLEDAEKATGAVMDHGVDAAYISLIASEEYREQWAHNTVEQGVRDEGQSAIHESKGGITTTTGADAGVGAVKGASIGLGVGLLAALSAVFLPGIGLVIGGGALALAASGAAVAIGGGAIAGGVYGFLKDQGVPEDVATSYRDTVAGGGVVLAISLADSIDRSEIEAVLSKYHALNVNRYGAASLI